MADSQATAGQVWPIPLVASRAGSDPLSAAFVESNGAGLHLLVDAAG
jgi:hypothetical protein